MSMRDDPRCVVVSSFHLGNLFSISSFNHNNMENWKQTKKRIKTNITIDNQLSLHAKRKKIINVFRKNSN